MIIEDSLDATPEFAGSSRTIALEVTTGPQRICARSSGFRVEFYQSTTCCQTTLSDVFDLQSSLDI